jgi:hypothetical protein
MTGECAESMRPFTVRVLHRTIASFAGGVP